MKTRLLFVASALCACTARASHPLITEDTGVLDKGAYEMEVHGKRGRDEKAGVHARSTDLSFVLGHGFAEDAQVQLDLPYVRESVDGKFSKGRGDASLAVKRRLFEKDGLSFVFKPELFLPTGRDEAGLGAGKVRWGANLVAGYALGRWELLLHTGYLRNRNAVGERRSLLHASVAALFSATEKTKLVIDVSSDTDPDPASSGTLREAVVGLIHALTEDVELGLGLKRGLSAAAEDRSALLGAKYRW